MRGCLKQMSEEAKHYTSPKILQKKNTRTPTCKSSTLKVGSVFELTASGELVARYV